MPVKRGEYNIVVRVTTGQHRNKIGYVDDEDGVQAIVYFCFPLEGPYFSIPYKHIEYAKDSQKQKFLKRTGLVL